MKNKIATLISFEQIKSKIYEIRNAKVLLDFDVAEIYGVETKRVNEAVISIAVGSRNAGADFTVLFGATPSAGSYINYTILN